MGPRQASSRRIVRTVPDFATQSIRSVRLCSRSGWRSSMDCSLRHFRPIGGTYDRKRHRLRALFGGSASSSHTQPSYTATRQTPLAPASIGGFIRSHKSYYHSLSRRRFDAAFGSPPEFAATLRRSSDIAWSNQSEQIAKLGKNCSTSGFCDYTVRTDVCSASCSGLRRANQVQGTRSAIGSMLRVRRRGVRRGVRRGWTLAQS